MAAASTAKKTTEQTPVEALPDHSTRLGEDHDVVAMPSRKADGSADQTEGYKVIGEGGVERSVEDVEAEAARNLGAPAAEAEADAKTAQD